MPYYRLYFMNPRNGQIEHFADFDAPDDQAAIALASEHEGQRALELWCHHRKVRCFERRPDPVVQKLRPAE